MPLVCCLLAVGGMTPQPSPVIALPIPGTDLLTCCLCCRPSAVLLWCCMPSPFCHRWHDLPRNSPAQLCLLLSQDAGCVRGAVGDLLGMLCQTLGSLALGFGVAFWSDWRMALVVTGTLPLLVVGAVIQTRWGAVRPGAALTAVSQGACSWIGIGLTRHCCPCAIHSKAHTCDVTAACSTAEAALCGCACAAGLGPSHGPLLLSIVANQVSAFKKCACICSATAPRYAVGGGSSQDKAYSAATQTISEALAAMSTIHSYNLQVGGAWVVRVEEGLEG